MDKLTGKHIVKIGDSIRNNQKSNLVAFMFDSVPDTVIRNKPGQVTNDSETEITVDLPNSSGFSTQFKGNIKEDLKECVLIHNKITGEWTLERLDYIVDLENTEKPGKKFEEDHVPGSRSTNQNDNLSERSEVDEQASHQSRHVPSQSQGILTTPNEHINIFDNFNKTRQSKVLKETPQVDQSMINQLHITDSESHRSNDEQPDGDDDEPEHENGNNQVQVDLMMSGASKGGKISVMVKVRVRE